MWKTVVSLSLPAEALTKVDLTMHTANSTILLEHTYQINEDDGPFLPDAWHPGAFCSFLLRFAGNVL